MSLQFRFDRFDRGLRLVPSPCALSNATRITSMANCRPGNISSPIHYDASVQKQGGGPVPYRRHGTTLNVAGWFLPVDFYGTINDSSVPGKHDTGPEFPGGGTLNQRRSGAGLRRQSGQDLLDRSNRKYFPERVQGRRGSPYP